MREYKIITLDNKNYLSCSEHRIVFDQYETAHKYWLALGLGTHPCPDKCPSYYLKLPHNGPSITYKVIKELAPQEDWAEESCCQSGCPNCPWAFEKPL
jgi:hypothetical protein